MKKKKIITNQKEWIIFGTNYNEYKSNCDKNRILLVEEYLNKIRPYLREIVNDLKESDTCKIQLTTTINPISSKDDKAIT